MRLFLRHCRTFPLEALSKTEHYKKIHIPSRYNLRHAGPQLERIQIQIQQQGIEGFRDFVLPIILP
jgi:hypothetical protein